MSAEFLPPEEAGRLNARLLRFQTTKGWSERELSRFLGIARNTLRGLRAHDQLTQRTASKVCAKLGLTATEVFGRVCYAPDDVFSPEVLAVASRFCRENQASLRLQILAAAATLLYSRCLVRGLQCQVSVPTMPAADRARVVAQRQGFQGSVSFSLLSGRLMYTLHADAPNGSVCAGTGSATETGFSFCLEFLQASYKPGATKRGSDLATKIQAQLSKHEFRS